MSKETFKGKVTLTDILKEFVSEGFFNKPRTFKEVRIKLEKEGIIIPSTTIHPVLSRLILNNLITRKRNNDFLWEFQKREMAL